MQNKWLLALLLPLMISFQLTAQTPSTEGKDFWVTFLRASENDGGPQELRLTFSSMQATVVTVTNPSTGYNTQVNLAAGSAQEVLIPQGSWNSCYSTTNETPTYTALHVTATADISLFAGNYRDKSFDAANILPTSSLLDDYLIQTYRPSDHEGKPQGSHFAIVAVEDNTVVDYYLTATTSGNKTGHQTATLNKGQVYYVWTGLKDGYKADLSGTRVTARDGKPIAIFQGCPHTNLPDSVRDRDHLFSQAMPLAYWGNEFAITASKHHRRDIVAVMAISDGTEVYVNSKDGEQVLVHTFDFSKEPKQYWEFEIGEALAYCADNPGQSRYNGELPLPLVVDSSCYLTTSCPAGIHIFMVSNRYDNVVPKVSSDTLVSDPAMLWVSPIEQVITDITFSTYHTSLAKLHYVNIVTPTANVPSMQLTSNNAPATNIASSFHPISGNPDYSFARIQLEDQILRTPCNYHLHGDMGFLAHVYGYGERESYAYSCGSSTVSRSIMLNGIPVGIDSVASTHFCAGDTVEVKLNIGHNTYQKVTYDYGDGTSDILATSTAKHVYETKGWYDMMVTATYINSCTRMENSENLRVSFYVSKPDTIFRDTSYCEPYDYTGELISSDTITYDCDSVKVFTVYHRMASVPTDLEITAKDSFLLNGEWIYETADRSYTYMNSQNCDSVVNYHINIVYCLDLEVPTEVDPECDGQTSILIDFFFHKGEIDRAVFVTNLHGEQREFEMTVSSDYTYFLLNVSEFEPGILNGHIEVHDPICMQTLSFPISIFVRLPNSIMHQKYDNVVGVTLAAIQQYDIRGYQWLIDGELKPEQSQSIYYQNAGFEPNQYIEVLVLMPNGQWLRSCRLNLTGESQMDNPFRDDESARKVMHDGNMYIMRDGDLYNTLGEKVD
ncbi:MAG: IgGFc-binding protein [Paludibacteraceae bacterium]|nr:IgGFc-binding protein [Paludibacteraceae bacterium]